MASADFLSNLLGVRCVDMTELDSMQRLIAHILSAKAHVEAPSPTTDLLQAGLLDSITLVELIVGIEEQFEIHVPLETIEIDHFRSIERIAKFVSLCHMRESGAQAKRASEAGGLER